jgi:hypothetical protein
LAFNDFKVRRGNQQERLAHELRDYARRVMRDATECPIAAVHLHLERCQDAEWIIRLCIAEKLVPDAETRFSGLQLANPHTLLDYLHAIDITREHHRAPAWLNWRSDEYEKLGEKIDVLAAYVAQLGKGGAR